MRLLSDPGDRGSAALRETNDVVGSQGVAWSLFALDRLGRERPRPAPDPDGFSLRGANLRRVEPRHTPSVVNAVFNHRNFWDGRAQPAFNGVTPFGARDPDAALFRAERDGTLREVRVSVPNASLASQAVAPPTDAFEMSSAGRRFPDVARRLAGGPGLPRLARRPLAGQVVHPRDSLLGPWSRAPLPGLSIDSYERWVQAAFRPEWWRSELRIEAPPGAAPRGVGARRGGPSADEYTLLEWNFSLFFGLAVQLYEATLVADDTPFDRWLVELTAPYFHDGGTRTLEDVVAFYSRGGDLEPLLARDGLAIRPLTVLDLSAQERADFVAFLRSLTDERVRFRRAPFDHPQLFVPDGPAPGLLRRSRERWIEVPAVGAAGGRPLRGFLE